MLEKVWYGIGKGLHEDSQVPNYGLKLREGGLVLAIESIINLGNKEIYQENDSCKVVTVQG